MWGDKELTYGHAMLEYCFFRWHTNRFIDHQVLAVDQAKLTDIFNIMRSALSNAANMRASEEFYLGKSYKRKKKKIVSKLHKAVHTETTVKIEKREDFNGFILSEMQQKGISREAKIKK